MRAAALAAKRARAREAEAVARRRRPPRCDRGRVARRRSRAAASAGAEAAPPRVAQSRAREPRRRAARRRCFTGSARADARAATLAGSAPSAPRPRADARRLAGAAPRRWRYGARRRERRRWRCRTSSVSAAGRRRDPRSDAALDGCSPRARRRPRAARSARRPARRARGRTRPMLRSRAHDAHAAERRRRTCEARPRRAAGRDARAVGAMSARAPRRAATRRRPRRSAPTAAPVRRLRAPPSRGELAPRSLPAASCAAATRYSSYRRARRIGPRTRRHAAAAAGICAGPRGAAARSQRRRGAGVEGGTMALARRFWRRHRRRTAELGLRAAIDAAVEARSGGGVVSLSASGCGRGSPSARPRRRSACASDVEHALGPRADWPTTATASQLCVATSHGVRRGVRGGAAAVDVTNVLLASHGARATSGARRSKGSDVGPAPDAAADMTLAARHRSRRFVRDRRRQGDIELEG